MKEIPWLGQWWRGCDSAIGRARFPTPVCFWTIVFPLLRRPPSSCWIVNVVYAVEPLGADTLLYGHVAGSNEARVAARLHASLPATEGTLGLRYDPAAVHWFDAASGKRIEA